MQNLFIIIKIACVLLFLQCGTVIAQSDEAIKLTRAEEAASYPTTFGTRYFVTPSAIPREKGKFSLHSTELRALSASLGLTKNVSLSAGFNVGVLFLDFEDALPFLTTKVGFEIAPKLYVGGGFFALHLNDNEGPDLLGFGMVTLGDRNTNITWTYMYDFTEGGITSGDDFRVVSPLSLSGMFRINKFISVVSENHLPSRSNRNLYHFAGFEGIRLIFKRNAIDLGAIVLRDSYRNYSFDGSLNKVAYYEWYPFFGYTFAF